MSRKLLIVLIVLSLTACGRRIVKDDSPAIDLDAQKHAMTRALAPRVLSNGKTYCAELAETEDAQDDCLGEVEEAFDASELDKARALRLFGNFIERLRIDRNPCGFWRGLFNRSECNVENLK